MKSVGTALLLGGAVLAGSLAAFAAPMPCKVDKAHSHIQFTAYTKLFDAVGKFKSYRVSGTVDPEDFTKSDFTVTVDVSTLDTDNGARDDHLRSDDFFDVDKYPRATFKTNKITKGKKPGWYVIHGTLAVKDKQVALKVPVEITTAEMGKGNKTTRLKAKFKVDRFKLGVDWDGSLLLPDIKNLVDMDVDLNFSHPPAKG